MSRTKPERLVEAAELLEANVTRRTFLGRSIALGLSVPAIGALLAACADDDDEPDDVGTTDPADDDDTEPADDDADEPGDEPDDEDDEDDAPAPDDDSFVQVRVIQDVETVDPAYIGKVTDYAIGHLVYNGLMQYESGGLEVIPDLATDWEVSDDGITYTFHIREGVQFHKGYGELTAEDFVYSLNRVRDPDTASQFLSDVSVIEDIEATDTSTVVITLESPFSPFLSAVIAFRPGFVIPQAAVEEKGEAFALDPIGTGPYQWDSRTRGTEVTVVRNPDYFDSVSIHTVHLKNIMEDSVAELAMQTGDLDVGYFFEPDTALRLLNGSVPGVEAAQLSGYRTQWAGFNFEREPIQDIRVRQAIIHAIDKHSAADAVGGELAEVVSSIFNPNIPSYIDPDPFPYDPDRAVELLDEAGYGDGLDLSLLVIPSTTWPDLAVVLQEQLRQVGINVELLTHERSVYDEIIAQEGATWDICTVNITRAEAYQYASYFLTQNIPGPNYHRYSNPEVDDIVARAAAAVDLDEQNELWQQFQQIVLIDDVVGFGMTNINQVLAWRDHVSNVDSLYFDCFPAWQFTVS